MPKGQYNRIHPAWNKGKKGIYSRETIKKMRKAKVENPPRNLFQSKEKHPNWKGGTAKTERQRIWKTAEYRLWRMAVFERDDYTCVFCGVKGGKLNADHIKPWRDYPELRFAIDNGRTLCVPCHIKTPTFGGKLC